MMSLMMILDPCPQPFDENNFVSCFCDSTDNPFPVNDRERERVKGEPSNFDKKNSVRWQSKSPDLYPSGQQQFFLCFFVFAYLYIYIIYYKNI